MKKVNYKLILASVVVCGLFIGIVRGQEARTKWISKMKNKMESKKSKKESPNKEVTLDDFEIASFHQN